MSVFDKASFYVKKIQKNVLTYSAHVEMFW